VLQQGPVGCGTAAGFLTAVQHAVRWDLIGGMTKAQHAFLKTAFEHYRHFK